MLLNSRVISKKNFHLGFLTTTSKLLRSQQIIRKKVEEKKPADLLPKAGAEKSTRRLPVRGLLVLSLALVCKFMSTAVHSTWW